jgi:hypothetical protein
MQHGSVEDAPIFDSQVIGDDQSVGKSQLEAHELVVQVENLEEDKNSRTCQWGQRHPVFW